MMIPRSPKILILLAFCGIAMFIGRLLAQIPIIPSLPVEQTQVPVFAEFLPKEAAQTAEHGVPLANFRLSLDYRLPNPDSTLSVRLGALRSLELKSNKADQWQKLDLQYEQLSGRPASFSATVNGKSIAENEVVPTSAGEAEFEKVRLDKDFTIMAQFSTTSDGPLFSKCRQEKWEPDAKLLGLRGGRLYYDIGWLGALIGRTQNLTDGKPHTVVVRSDKGSVTLFVDGKNEGTKAALIKPDREQHQFHVGQGARDFGGQFTDGGVENLRFWERSLTNEEATLLTSGKPDAVNTPIINWHPEAVSTTFPKGIPGVPTKIALVTSGGAEIRQAWVQPLADTDHARILSRWSEEGLAEGGKIYQTLCVTCHGTTTQEGSMPTSRRFHKEPFKNGNDPFRQFQTLTQGYGLMIPLPQYTAEQKYAIIHYIRETFTAPHNKGELFQLSEAYLDSLPKAMHSLPKQQAPKDDSQQYVKMNFGPMLEWTYQVAPDNIAYKGIAVRLDGGDGGVSKGHIWMTYDHDTMRVASASVGEFMDWKGVAFDGSHGTHASLTGERVLTNPVGPGWANPLDGSWNDPRFRGRDGKPYGPLPKEWASYKGSYLHGSRVIQSYTVGDASVLDAPEAVEYGKTPIFIRALTIGKSSHELKLRIAPESDALQLRVMGSETLRPSLEAGFQILTIPASATPVNLRIVMTKGTDSASVDALVQHAQLPMDLATLTHGGPARWPQVVKTQGGQGNDDGPFATDILTHPESSQNPWESWMRLTAFDFFADGERAAVCTWMGDVWIVDGLAKQPLGELKWQRVATGLFQPLGLKVVHETIHVTCRDQLVKLHDLNGDGEIDFYECFNNDAQVTEHFHEFAMGLQTDAEGNFYYAKSACHARPAVVEQHGTLLRVSADGSHTDILASGFRAANGVCLNPDGTFFVTDQEGHWTPKNRINLVQGKGPAEFYGNMLSYYAGTDTSDAAMKQPVCWITNTFDRSPSELLWVPKDAKWGRLNGTLLNLSYGYGKIYTVPYEQLGNVRQGGMCALPMPQFPTGVMRGRFNPKDGQFYGCGMFAWAGNQSQPGGFYRVRATGKPALQPIGLHFEKGRVGLEFSDALDPKSIRDVSRYTIKAWGLKRSENYGSPHVDEHPLAVEKAELGDDDARMLWLTVPKLHVTMGLEIACKLKLPDGTETERVVDGTINTLPLLEIK